MGSRTSLFLLLAAVLAVGIAGAASPSRAGLDRQKPAKCTPPKGTVIGTPDEVFILAGQSNMSGRGRPAKKGTCNTSPQLLEWVNGGWQVATDPLRGVDKEKGVGPGMTFGLRVLQYRPNETVGLILCSVGGTSITQWLPSGSLYQTCVSEALATGRPLGGMLFLQGESDSHYPDEASTWKANFQQMLDAYRAQFGPQVPFLLGQIGALDGPAAAIVRQQQAEAAAENPRVALVVTDDLPMEPDHQHFPISSYKVIGERFGDAWWSLAGP
jgi:Carbohydrate esterase, sialic acid-specific acetylesterase